VGPTLDIILVICTVLLCCGFGGVLLFRLSHPLLRGLGWLSGSFAAGCLGALLVLLPSAKVPAVVCYGFARVFVLLAFVLLHVAVLELMKAKSLFSTLSIVLLGLVALSGLLTPYWQHWDMLGTAVLDFAVTIQVFQTAFYMLADKSQPTRNAALFMGTLLLLFGSFNGLRSVAIATGLLDDPTVSERLQGVTFVVYVMTALGSAFGLFWMSTALVTAHLEAMANTDPLTGVPNRRIFLEQCQREIAACKRTRKVCSVLMVDLDHFKQINDRYGHAFGDIALCKAIERIKLAIRTMDTLARWGGEEFCVLLPNATLDMALVVAERIRMSVESTNMKAPDGALHEGHTTVSLTVSIGAAVYDSKNHDAQDIIQRADHKLFEAKRAGRNRVM